jgi:hypothetical protein
MKLYRNKSQYGFNKSANDASRDHGHGGTALLDIDRKIEQAMVKYYSRQIYELATYNY